MAAAGGVSEGGIHLSSAAWASAGAATRKPQIGERGKEMEDLAKQLDGAHGWGNGATQGGEGSGRGISERAPLLALTYWIALSSVVTVTLTTVSCPFSS